MRAPLRSPALLAAAFVAGTLGCAPAAARPPGGAADLGSWTQADEPAAAPTRRLGGPPVAPRDGAAAPLDDRVIAAPRDVPLRPRSRGRIDVDLHLAEMASAFRLLADAGGFNLVIQEGLSAKVSATMHGVDPYDALLVLARANGAEVRYEQDVVVVTKR